MREEFKEGSIFTQKHYSTVTLEKDYLKSEYGEKANRRGRPPKDENQPKKRGRKKKK